MSSEIKTNWNAGDQLNASELNANFLALINMEFSDGRDGDVDIITTVQLTSDMYYKKLTIESGGVLQTNGYRVYAHEIDLQSGGEINEFGGVGGDGGTGNNGGVAGTQAHSGGILQASSLGEIGGDTSADAQDGDDINNSLGVNGVAGGDGSDEGIGDRINGGDAGVVSLMKVQNKIDINFTRMLFGIDANSNINYAGSSAGSGSGGNAVQGGQTAGFVNGGGSGAPGGIILLFAKKITLNGTINVYGGNGGDGAYQGSPQAESSGAGGGGAGSGGVLVLTCETIDGTTGIINIYGGIGGNGGDGDSDGGSRGYGGNAGDGGNGGNFYKLYYVDNSSITINKNGGNAGSGGTGDNGNGTNGTNGTVGTVYDIQMDLN